MKDLLAEGSNYTFEILAPAQLWHELFFKSIVTTIQFSAEPQTWKSKKKDVWNFQKIIKVLYSRWGQILRLLHFWYYDGPQSVWPWFVERWLEIAQSVSILHCVCRRISLRVYFRSLLLCFSSIRRWSDAAIIYSLGRRRNASYQVLRFYLASRSNQNVDHWDKAQFLEIRWCRLAKEEEDCLGRLAKNETLGSHLHLHLHCDHHSLRHETNFSDDFSIEIRIAVDAPITRWNRMKSLTFLIRANNLLRLLRWNLAWLHSQLFSSNAFTANSWHRSTDNRYFSSCSAASMHISDQLFDKTLGAFENARRWKSMSDEKYSEKSSPRSSKAERFCRGNQSSILSRELLSAFLFVCFHMCFNLYLCHCTDR